MVTKLQETPGFTPKESEGGREPGLDQPPAPASDLPQVTKAPLDVAAAIEPPPAEPIQPKAAPAPTVAEAIPPVAAADAASVLAPTPQTTDLSVDFSSVLAPLVEKDTEGELSEVPVSRRVTPEGDPSDVPFVSTLANLIKPEAQKQVIQAKQAADVEFEVQKIELPKTEAPEATAQGLELESDNINNGVKAAIAQSQNPKNGVKATSLEIAQSYLGLDDRNKAHAKTIGAFIKKAAGLDINPHTTAWCAAFANAVLGVQGYEGTDKLNARSFLDWGQPTNTPDQGDVVVLWREDPSSWKGHVGFFAGTEERPDANGQMKTFIKVMGGNQGDKVSINSYPADRLLGFRKPPRVS